MYILIVPSFQCDVFFFFYNIDLGFNYPGGRGRSQEWKCAGSGGKELKGHSALLKLSFWAEARNSGKMTRASSAGRTSDRSVIFRYFGKAGNVSCSCFTGVSLMCPPLTLDRFKLQKRILSKTHVEYSKTNQRKIWKFLIKSQKIIICGIYQRKKCLKTKSVHK